jgi:hypothetical protein
VIFLEKSSFLEEGSARETEWLVSNEAAIEMPTMELMPASLIIFESVLARTSVLIRV